MLAKLKEKPQSLFGMLTGQYTTAVIVGTLLMLANLTGCTAKGSYDTIQHSNARDCEELPASAREKCLDRLGKSYEDYQRDRKHSVDT